jgi:hypothetical protein
LELAVFVSERWPLILPVVGQPSQFETDLVHKRREPIRGV